MPANYSIRVVPNTIPVIRKSPAGQNYYRANRRDGCGTTPTTPRLPNVKIRRGTYNPNNPPTIYRTVFPQRQEAPAFSPWGVTFEGTPRINSDPDYKSGITSKRKKPFRTIKLDRTTGGEGVKVGEGRRRRKEQEGFMQKFMVEGPARVVPGPGPGEKQVLRLRATRPVWIKSRAMKSEDRSAKWPNAIKRLMFSSLTFVSPASPSSPGVANPPAIMQVKSNRTFSSTLTSGLKTVVEGAASVPSPPSSTIVRKEIFTGLRVAGGVCLVLGLLAGWAFDTLVNPSPPPEPGSREDEATVRMIRQTAEKLPVVQSLSFDEEWTSWEAYSGIAEKAKLCRITTGPLAGSRGVGAYQRVFHNTNTGEVVVVIWLGSATTGWPGVVHGGCLATIMDECLGRTAIACFEERTGVTARLEMKYVSPAPSNAFFVVRTVPEIEGGEEHGIVGETGEEKGSYGGSGWFDLASFRGGNAANKSEKPQGRKKLWVSGRLETVEGKVCVEARGLFVVPKRFKLRSLQEEF